MTNNERIKAYAKQINLPTTGAFKNSTATKRLVSRLTPRQQRRIAAKANRAA